jgi:hypothetical protein
MASSRRTLAAAPQPPHPTSLKRDLSAPISLTERQRWTADYAAYVDLLEALGQPWSGGFDIGFHSGYGLQG